MKKNNCRYEFFICLFLLLFSPNFLNAGVLVVSNFEGGKDPLSLDSASSLSSTDVTIVTATYVAHSNTEPAHGNRGYSLKVQHLTTGDGYLLLQFGNAVDLRGYRTLSFWIRGASGSEYFKMDLRRTSSPTEPSYRPNLKEFMTSELTTEWRKVNIPIKTLFKEVLTENYSSLSNVDAIVLNFTNTTAVETIYLDDISFHSETGNVMVDQFDDGSSPTLFGHDPFGYTSGGSGASVTLAYDSEHAYGGSGYALRVMWSTGTSLPTDAFAGIEIDTRVFTAGGIGVDITGTDTLSLQVKGHANADGKLIGVGLGDDSGAEKIHASSITLTTSFQEVTRALSGFSVSKDSASEVEFWFINATAGNGPPISAISGATFYVDNIQFLDTTNPTTPSSFKKSNVSMTDGLIFYSTDTLSVTADAQTSDSTLERIRFEHDNLSGGTQWYTISTDTDTATKTSHTTSWDNFFQLVHGSSYQVRAVAEDVAGNESKVTFTSISLAPNSPGIVSYQVNATSVSVTLSTNSNPIGTTLSITTASFEVSATSSALFSSGNITLTLSNLVPHRAYYNLKARATSSSNVLSSNTAVTSFGTVPPEPKVGKDGGTIKIEDDDSSDGETGVTIPKGALTQDVLINIVALDPQNLAKYKNQTALISYEFTPKKLTFAKPVTLTLLYSDKNQDGIVDGSNLKEGNLKLFWFDGFEWRNLGGEINRNNNTVSAKISHFSIYGLFSALDPSSEEVRPKEKIITPNGDKINDFAQFGISGNFEIKIFDSRGKKVRALENLNIWDGRGDSGELVASGVYIYQVKSDRLDVSGTLGVAR
ncbi:MAG: hypothetical protein A3B80_04665 [Elusimicrobia bacterium RIFCSPHIGHO2_02_FULL_39_36]|nr:MAG: hypothetical protein A3B80_04665 [Elusimicrobia bacterium RIFCSPHIGHO2_02_FULL_39_36]OGS00900.1 MAG: hypothetical protein A3G85_00255 [Elusimicrobia bacterium RIFCSPLOWO2_12_FULL_39_28]